MTLTGPKARIALAAMKQKRGRRLLRAVVLLAVVAGTVAAAYSWWTDRPLREARAAYREQQWLRAMDLAVLALKQGAEPDQAWELIGSANCRLGRFAEGDALLRKAPIGRLAPETLDLWAAVLVQQHWWPQAIDVLTELQRRRPDHGAVLQRLAVLQFQVGRSDEALALARRLRELPQSAAAAYCIEGTIHESAGRHSEAIDCLSRTLELVGRGQAIHIPPAQVLEKLVRNLAWLSRFDEAESYLRMALAQAPNPGMLCELAEILFQRGDSAAARDHWFAALRIKKNDTRAFMGLGRLAVLENQTAEALGWFKLAKAHGESSSGLEYMIASAYRRLGRDDLAGVHQAEHSRLAAVQDQIDREQRTVMAAQGSPHALLVLARNAIREGDWREAEGLLLELQRQFPQDPDVLALRQEAQRLRTTSLPAGSAQ
jgi:tetratricopeptide (TPR) repeat protein